MNAKQITRPMTLLSTAIALALVAPMAATPAYADARAESSGAFQKAQALFNKGDFRSARIELLKAIKANPDNAIARLLQARTALELGNGIVAQTELEKAITAGIPREKTQHLMAHAFLLQRQYTRAFEMANEGDIPPQFGAYAARIRGRAMTGLKRPEAAREHFVKAEQLAPRDPETLVDLSRYYIFVAEMPKATELVDRAIDLHPTFAKALLVKGNIERQTKGLAAALPFFNRALESDPNNIEALLERAATLGDLNRDKEARADLKRVTGLVPDHALALYLDAVMETRAGRYEQAQALMTRTKGQLNDYPPALLLQGMIAFQVNNMAQANEYLAKVVAATPRSVIARKLYAAAQLRKGDAQGAIDTLKPLMNTNAMDARTLAMLGSAYARMNDFATSQKYFEQAVTAAPNEGGLRTQLAMSQLAQGDANSAGVELQKALAKDENSLQALMMLALLDLRGNRYDQALATSNKIIKQYPELPMGYNLRGAAALGLNNSKVAEANFRLALQKKPDFQEARRNLAQLMVSSGRNAEARQELLKSLEVNKNDTRAMFGLARLSAAEGKVKEQIAWLKRAAAVSPTLFGPRSELTQVYIQSGMRKEALDEASALIRDFPREPRALELAALINIANGRLDEAEKVYNQLVSLQPTAAGPRLLLARAQEANGKLEDARTTLTRALTMPQAATGPIYVDLISFEGRRGRWDAAQSYAARLRALTKTNVADLALGDAYMAAGQKAKALAQYQAAQKLRSDRTAAMKVASGYMSLRQVPQALGVLTAYSKQQPNDARIQASIADIYMTQRQYRQALPIYEKLRVQTKGMDAGVLNNLAFTYQVLGDKRMVPTAQAAYRLAPQSAAVADTYGWILLTSKGNAKLALQLLQRAAKGAPRDPDIRYHLAVAYQVNGNKDQAVKELQTALKKPQFNSRAQAQALLAKLR